jgi:hypothetical protein
MNDSILMVISFLIVGFCLQRIFGSVDDGDYFRRGFRFGMRRLKNGDTLADLEALIDSHAPKSIQEGAYQLGIEHALRVHRFKLRYPDK